MITCSPPIESPCNRGSRLSPATKTSLSLSHFAAFLLTSGTVLFMLFGCSRGRWGAFSARGSVKGNLHRSETLDYALVLKGEVWHLTEMDEVLLRQGDVLVQRGTVHNWINRGTEACTIAFVLVAAEPVKRGDQVLNAVG